MEINVKTIIGFFVGLGAILLVPTTSFIYYMGESNQIQKSLYESIENLDGSVKELTDQTVRLSKELSAEQVKINQHEIRLAIAEAEIKTHAEKIATIKARMEK